MSMIMAMINNTTRNMVAEIQNEIAKGNLMPERASELLVQLAALLGNLLVTVIKSAAKHRPIHAAIFMAQLLVAPGATKPASRVTRSESFEREGIRHWQRIQ